MRNLLIGVVFLFFAGVYHASAQRSMEKLDRGVVAVNKGSNQLFISWRFLATDPDDIAFNLYRQIGTGTATLLNSTPITGATNYVWTVTGTDLSTASRIFVKPVINGIEGAEGGSWNLVANQPAGLIVRDFTFQSFPAGYPKMSMKFCWPGDLDGDGQYDFIVDRHPGGVIESDDDTSTPGSVYIDAYNSDGTFKWRINVGVNVIIGSGQADMVTVYDMDGDGKAEVMMAISEGTTFPNGTVIKNADGTVHDYSSVAGSAPQWMAILNGQTGNLIDTISLSFFDEIKSDRSDKWKAVSGQCVIQYLDGIHPSLVYQYKSRKATGAFTGATEAWSFDGSKLVKQWAGRFPRENTEYEGHQFRAADVDGDGKDEMVQISYAIDDNGTMLYSVPGIAHGDRQCLADIDPDRPGLEHFFIQQTNILGFGIHDAATGEMIKAHYLSAVDDVDRATCAAFIPTTRGMQYYTTKNSNTMYNCKGKPTTSTGSFPAEALWWGGDLSRREIDAAGDDKNPIIEAYAPAYKSMVRSVNMYKGSVNGKADYYFRAPNGGRAAFWGDILGDWREELIYGRTDTLGFVILSTYDLTTHRQYCLMQNPAYRIQTTARGYYQTADVDFYMAADMPEPPVAPVQTADVYLTDGNAFTSSSHNGKSVMLDIRNTNNDISLNEDVALTRLWLMNPKGRNFTISGTGKFTGSMDVVKSMQGDVTFNGNYDYTGETRISEGRLFVNGTLTSPVQLDARGVIGGNATLKGGITLETGLNIEGGRLEPGNDAALGTMTIVGSLSLPGRNNLAFDLDQSQSGKSDKLAIQGDFLVTGTNHCIIIKPQTELSAGEFTLVTFTGTTNATKSNFTVKGLEGIPYSLIFEANAIKLVVTQPRSAGIVEWRGGNSQVWDFETKNFLKNATEDIFVPGDSITFNDNAVSKTITINETMPVGKITFTNNADYKISGDGVISGNCGLLKTGSGALSLLNEDNEFTGGIDFSDGILEVASLKDGGISSSIGASSGDAGNWIMRNATLQTAGQMATTRNMLVYGKLTVNNPGTNSVMIGGNITGNNVALELNGTGTLNLQGKNSLSSVTVKNGILSLGSINANNYGVGSGTVTLEGGTLQMLDSNTTSMVGPWTNTIDVPEGKSARWSLPMRWNFTNKLTGKGTLTLYIPYVRDEFRGDWSAFEGTIKITADGDGGDFRISNTYGYAKATFDLAANTYMYHLSTGNTIKLGGISGVSTAKLTGNSTTWNVGGNNTSSLTFAGVISGTGSNLIKEGTGTLTLSGANTYNGVTTISNGTLVVANTTGSATGTGAVTVNSGGKLAGTGIVTGAVTANSGSTIAPGTSTIGTLRLGSTLTLGTGSSTIIKLNLASNTQDTVRVLGAATLAGTLNMQLLSGAFAAGNAFNVINAASYSGTFSNVVPAVPGIDMNWDLSTIATDGTIRVVAVTKTNQTVTIGTIADKTYGDADFALPTATASTGLEITYSSSNTAVATISGSNVHIVGGGTCNIIATQGGNYTYNPASASTPLTVNKATQSVTFGALSSKTYGDAAFTLSATSSSGLATTYTSSNTSVATISGNTVTIVGAGTTTITAAQNGNANYSAASAVQQDLTVNKAEQAISFLEPTPRSFSEGSLTLVASSSSGLPVSYSSSNTDVATVSGNVLTFVAAGSTVITASQSGNANYNVAADVSRSFTINKANQSIEFNTIDTLLYGDGSFTLTATASSGLPVTISSSNADVLILTGDQATITGAGLSTIEVSQAGNGNYNAATSSQTVVVKKAVLNVSVSDTFKAAYAENPTFRLIYNGFVYTDGVSNLDAQPVASCLAATDSPEGSYSITLSGGQDNNYDFVYTNGMLTVMPYTSVNRLKNDKISVYPNPVKDVVNVDFSNISTPARVSVLDISGNNLMNISVDESVARINVSSLEAGMYILRINTTGDCYEQKIIKY
jgi:autotransporter-associated beta strand protein